MSHFSSFLKLSHQLSLCLLVSSCASLPAVTSPSTLPAVPNDQQQQEKYGFASELVDWHLLEFEPLIEEDLTVPIKPVVPQSRSTTRSNLRANPRAIRPANPRAKSITVQLIDAPIQQVLHGLATDAQLQLKFNQTLEGSVTLLSENQSLEHVLHRISLQVPFHWQIDDGVLSL